MRIRKFYLYQRINSFLGFFAQSRAFGAKNQSNGLIPSPINSSFYVLGRRPIKAQHQIPHILQRADRIQDAEDDLSEMPHVILSQARIHDFYLDVMRNSPHRLQPDYSRELVDLTTTDDSEFPVQARLTRLDKDTGVDTIRARFVVGCDGARSTVRKSMGHQLRGETARQLWGVMDVLVVTDFPDIRLKTAIQSAEHGSVLIIPREGGYLVRLYIELDDLKDNERVSDRNVSSDMLIEKARNILAPFTFDVKEVAWWSAYEIGQRVCDAFDNVPDTERDSRAPFVFIAGDACHTHSPKAGQGMNVSMADTFNLGWKLAAVLRGQADPKLLHSYSLERQAKAQELIDFDRDMARLFSARPQDTAEAEQFQQYFQKHARYTAGVETRYDPSLITADTQHQGLADGLKVGMRFHSAPVVRLSDGKPFQLSHVLEADGRWRLLAFAGSDDQGQVGGAISNLCDFLTSKTESPLRRYSDPSADIDSLFDVRAVFQASHQTIRLTSLPKLLLPKKGRYGLIDYEKAFCPNLMAGPDIFYQRGINRTSGALIIIRPDQFVANVLPITDFDRLANFFAGFMIKR